MQSQVWTIDEKGGDRYWLCMKSKTFQGYFFYAPRGEVNKAWNSSPTHTHTSNIQSTEMAATAEPMEDEFAVAGPLPLSRLEVKLSLTGTSLMMREMESLREISRNSLKLVIILLKVLPIRISNHQ